MSEVKAIPAGYEGVTPYLICKNAGAAIDFYKRAFGATEIYRIGPPGMIVCHHHHARLPQQSQRLVHHRPPHQPARLPPVISRAVSIQIHHRLLHHVLGGGAIADDGAGNRQQPTRMQADRPLEKFVRRVGHREVIRVLSCSRAVCSRVAAFNLLF